MVRITITTTELFFRKMLIPEDQMSHQNNQGQFSSITKQ